MGRKKKLVPRRTGPLARVPLEAQEQLQIVQWLRFRQHVFFHCANNARSARAAIVARSLGASAGIPDLLILSVPRRKPQPGTPMALRFGEGVGGAIQKRCAKCLGFIPFKGVAIEVKRQKGGRVSPQQKQWIEDLERLGWLAFVAKGADAAIQTLTEAGY